MSPKDDAQAGRLGIRRWILILVTVAFLSLAPGRPAFGSEGRVQSQTGEKVSRFGEYRGWSVPLYDSWVRTSRYLTMRDGVRLAADIIRPAAGGQVEEKPLPAIFTHTRYRRAAFYDGKLRSEADSPLSQDLLRHGYIVCVVDVRGSGASFGNWTGVLNPDETRDAHEIIEWLAAQPWCDGNIGMTGGSYLGGTQLMAASTKPPHLKAIFPAVPLFDVFEIGSHGGVFFDDLVRTWSDMTRMLDVQSPAAPVDEDPEGSLLKLAIDEHTRNRSAFSIISPLKFRDSKDEATGALVNRDWHPAGNVRTIAEAGVPTYILGGWFDSFTRDVFLLWKNLGGPNRLTVGRWSHSPRDPELQKEEFGLAGVEQLRWFDRWLKDIENGVDDEPPIRYQVMKTPREAEWRDSADWPVRGARSVDYFFQGGRSGSVASANDGLLGTARPAGAVRAAWGRDVYTVDYTTTSGQTSRWDNAVGGDFGYPDMTENDRKSLTYTTPPLERDVEVTGHPVVRMWASSTAGDGDYFVFLEEVDAAGVSHYVTEGTIRASSRALGQAPFDYFGLPYLRRFAEDVKTPAPGEAVELVFDLLATSNVFEAGNRIRVTVSGADKDNAETKPLTPAPQITLYREAERSTRIALPVVGAAETETGEAASTLTQSQALLLGLLIVLGIFLLVLFFTYYNKRQTARKPR